MFANISILTVGLYFFVSGARGGIIQDATLQCSMSGAQALLRLVAGVSMITFAFIRMFIAAF